MARAERFVLLDTKGRERAVLEMLGDQPHLRFYDEERRLRSDIGEGEITIYDANQQRRVQISSGEIGVSGVEVSSGDGVTRATLTARQTNDMTSMATLNLTHKGRSDVLLSAGDLGEGFSFTSNGKPTILLNSGPPLSESPSLIMRPDDGTNPAVVLTPLSRNGQTGGLTIRNLADGREHRVPQTAP